jgi:hypothetical protein
MSENTFHELVVLFSGGVGLLLLACLVLPFAGRWSRRVRTGVTIAVMIASAMIPVAFDSPSLALIAAALIATIAGVVLLACPPNTMRAFHNAAALLRYRATRAGLVGAIGLALVAVGFARFDVEDQKVTDRDDAFLSESLSRPTMQPAVGASATTDAGRSTRILEPDEIRPLDKLESAERRLLSEHRYSERIIRLGPLSDLCNCHGWVFTGGRYWLSEIDVEHILVDNGYQPTSDPRPDDLAIYRDDSGAISHTAVVRAAGDGKPVLVEGKWGWMGVFVHEVADSCWGKNYTYFRSQRHGHLLVGLGGSPDRPSADHGRDSIGVEEP